MKDTDTKEMPWDFWNYDINPILGYKWKRPSLSNRAPRDKYEYDENDNIKL